MRNAARPPLRLARLARPVRLHGLLPLAALGACLAASAPVPAGARNPAGSVPAVRSLMGGLPLHFEANRGQAAREFAFLARGAGYTLGVSPARVVVALSHTGRGGGRTPRTDRAATVSLDLLGARKDARVVGDSPRPGKVNYFLGNDRQQWRTGIPTFGKVRVEGVYPGIDVVHYGRQRELEHDFLVAPGADPGRIRLGVQGARPRLTPQGDLALAVPGGELVQRKPVAYQDIAGRRIPVACSYRLQFGTTKDTKNTKGKSGAPVPTPTSYSTSPAPNTQHPTPNTPPHPHTHTPTRPHITFELGPYDHSKPLVVDPVLGYASYLGGNGDDGGVAVAVDNAKNAVIAGHTSSTNLPVGGPPFQSGNAGGYDVFVARVNPDGTALLSLTYLGTNTTDYCYGMAIDAANNIYLAGTTYGASFPTINAYQAARTGNPAAYLSKLNPTGSSLLYSTYFSFNVTEFGSAIALDGQKAYLGGNTNSVNLPKINPFQNSFQGGTFDGFIAKFDTTLQGAASLLYCSYLGGNGEDQIQGLAFDPGNNAVVAVGNTKSTNFPVQNAIQGAYGAGTNSPTDGFATRLTGGGSTLGWSTYLGGNLADEAHAVAVDGGGNAYVGGMTSSNGFPVANAIQPTKAAGQDAFLTKISPAGAALFSTYLGGNSTEDIYGLAVDAAGGATATGRTASSDFPQAALDNNPFGGYDTFVTRYTPSGNAFVYSFILGGNSTDYGLSVALDGNGDAYVTGSTSSTTFPVRNNPFQPLYSGASSDAFIYKIFSGSSGTSAVRSLQFAARPRPEGGALLAWETAFEERNLGFNVYRDAGGSPGAGPLNRALVGGSALLTGTGDRLPGGYRYSLVDPAPDGRGYWVEDVDLGGAHTLHGPFPGPGRGGLSVQAAGNSDPVGSTFQGRASRSAVGATGANPLAAQAGLEIEVDREGWYLLPGALLRASRLSGRGIDAASLRLYAPSPSGPREVPIAVTDEGVLFYGIGVDTASTDTRVYWLARSSGKGRRLGSGGWRVAPGPLTPSFQDTVEYRERSVYFPSLHNGDAPNFFGALVSGQLGDVVEQPLEVQSLGVPRAGVPATATLEVSLQGVTASPFAGPNHRVEVSLNGTTLGTLVFGGQQGARAAYTLPHSLLVEGANQVGLRSVGGDADYSLVDTVRLTYWRSYAADGPGFRFTAPAGGTVQLSGLAEGALRVLDVTDPDAPSLVPAAPGGDGTALVVAPGPSGKERTLYAAVEPERLDSADLRDYTPPTWLAGSPAAKPEKGGRRRGGDLIVIGPESFLPEARPLVKQRGKEGHTVVTVALEDVFAAFSGGQEDPEAIRRLLRWAGTAWENAPRYLLLLGDASADPRGYLGGSASSLVPTSIVDADPMEIASDDALVEGLQPPVAVGRLPARTAEEAALMVGKTLQSGSIGAGKAVLVTGTGSDYNFGRLTDQVKGLLPSGAQVIAGTNALGALVGALNQGTPLVHYSGHGSNYGWAGPMFTTDTAHGLTNSRLPLVVTMTCLNGAFQEWRTESLAEALLRAPSGGAWAVWASSGLSDPALQESMDRAFFQALRSGSRCVGDAVRAGKGAAISLDVRRSWIFFGDPSAPVQ